MYKTKFTAWIGGVLLSVLLAGCGGGSSSGTEVFAPGASKSANGLVIEPFVTDATAVQAAAPPTTGKSDLSEHPTGLLGYYAGTAPTRLVVFCHGLGHNVEKSWIEHVRRTVRPDTAVVTTNYRDNGKMPILRGALDTIAATLMAKQRFPSVKTVYLLGVSLGGAVSGTAITESVAVSSDGKGLYDYWVDVEGLVNLPEAYGEAMAALPEIATDLEEETGGNPLTQPQAYQRRSPALRAQEMAAAGLKAVVQVHDFNDGLVVYNQAREMAAALIAARIPLQLFNVLRHKEGQNAGTAGTAFLGGLLGLDDPGENLSLAGHGGEADYNHPVIRTGFEQLELMLNGTYDETTPYNEHLVDDGG